jgi:N-acetylornithine carbamoyltransferase
MAVDNALKGRDYIRTQDFTMKELETILQTSFKLKSDFKNGIAHDDILRAKTVFLLFFDKSTRTRNAFEAGITQLGGHAHYIDISTSQIAHGETAQDTGIILSSYGHGIAIRHDLEPYAGEQYMRAVANWADKPVINLQSDIDHPTQTIADLMTIQEKFGRNLNGLKIAVSWAYAPSYAKPLSVPQGLIMLMTRFGMNVTLAHPPEFKLMPEIIKIAEDNAKLSGGKFETTDSMENACEGAHVVYAKSWGIIDLFGKPQEALELAKKYKNWICDARIMNLGSPDSVYMHCLPADRGNEVTDEVIDSPRSIVWQEAENRLHTAKALMALTM